MFKGFKPQGLQKIATRMGYAGSMENFDDYLKQNPDKEREMIVYRSKAQEMAKGGAVVKMSDMKIPVALVFAMAVQLVGLVWYISNIVHDIEHLQGQVSAPRS